MPILNNEDQQLLHRKIWGNISKKIYYDKMGILMKIIGRVVGVVQLKDIGRNVALNQILELNELEVNKSNDLQNAIKMRWVEVISDRGMLKRAVVLKTDLESEEDKNKEKMLELACEMAKTMASEILKDSQKQNENLVQELKKEISDLKKNFKEKVVVQTVNEPSSLFEGKETFVLDEEIKPENIFIDINEKDEVKANVKEVGKIKEEKTDLSNSLNKMKKFKKKSITKRIKK